MREARRSRRAEPLGRPDDSVDRRLASRELGRANRAIQAVRTFLIVLAVINGIVGVALLHFAGEVWESERSAYWIEGLVRAGLTCVLVVGAVRIRRQPIVWTTVAAVLQSLGVGVAMLAGGGSIGIAFGIVFALGCWAALGAVRRAAPLIEEYGDLRMARKLTGAPARRGRRGGR